MREWKRIRIKKRRAKRGGLGRIGLLVSLLGIGVVVLFVISRVVTDRVEWVQGVWWVPAGWWLVGVWGLGLISVVVGLFEKKRSVVGSWLRWGLVVGGLGMGLFVFFGVWRVHRGVFQGGGLQEDNLGGVRLVHWNIAAGEFDVERASVWLMGIDADVVLISNARWDGQRAGLIEGLRGMIGGDESEDTGGTPVPRGSGRVMMLGSAVVVSRLPVLKTSMVYLQPSEDAEEGTRSTGDRGWVGKLMFGIEEKTPSVREARTPPPQGRGRSKMDDGSESIDGNEGGLVVWLVDLPSEPTAWRMETVGRAVDAIENGKASVRVYHEDGRVEFVADDGSMDWPGVVIGDFNVPRGSGSLKQFDVFEGGGEKGGGLSDAFVERGSGRAGSWRASGLTGIRGLLLGRSSWHIDLSLVGNGWGVEGYALVMPDGAVWGDGVLGVWGVSHRAQVVDIIR